MSPGARIRMLRIILGLSREEFCENHAINFNTLTSIELDRLKISSKQLHKIIHAFSKEGLYVDALWIMEAKGVGPSRFLSHIQHAHGALLENWARFFTDNKNAVISQVTGDFMEPFYSAGDLVGGIWNTAPQLLLGKKCIVHYDNRLHVGLLFHDREMFSLSPSNPHLHHGHRIFPCEAARVAEVLWHIRKHSHQIPELSSFDIYRK